MGLNEPGLAKMVQDIQMLEKSHLEKRVVINDKTVKLAMLDYEQRKQRFIKKSYMKNSLKKFCTVDVFVIRITLEFVQLFMCHNSRV